MASLSDVLVLLSTLCSCDLVQSALGTRRHGNWWFLLQYIQVHILGLPYAWKFPVKIFIYEKGTHTKKPPPDSFWDRKQKGALALDDLSADKKRWLHFYLAVATKQKIPLGVANFVARCGSWNLTCCGSCAGAMWAWGQKWPENPATPNSHLARRRMVPTATSH